MRTFISTTTLGLAGLITLGLIATTGGAASAGDTEVGKRDEDTPELVLVTDDDDDDDTADRTRDTDGPTIDKTIDKTNDRTNDRTNGATGADDTRTNGVETRSRVSRDHTASHATGVSRDDTHR